MVAATVFHVKTATAPDDPTYNIVVGDWNSAHTVSVQLQPADFANSNGVTFGVNTAGVVTATVAAGGAAQTGISGISAGTTFASSGTVSFSNASGVSWGLNGQTLTASVKTDYQTSGAYLTTAGLSQDSSKYAGTSTGMTGGSVTLNTSGIAINLPAYLTTARGSTDAIGLNTAGSNITWTANSSGLSIDARNYAGTVTAMTSATATLNSAGLSLSIGAYITTGALSGDTSKYAQVWSLAGANTAGTTTQNIGSEIYFSGGNNVTISGNVSTLVFSIPNVLTTARGSTDAIGLNTAGTNITWTANSSGLSINNAGLAGTTTAITGAASITLNSGGLNFNIGAYITTADLSGNSSNYARNWKLTGNSAGTQSSAIGTDLWLAGGQGITLSGSSNSISFSVGSYITTGDLSANSSNYARNWKLTGNSAGTQSSAIGTDLWLAGGANITLSGSSNSISFSVGNYLTTARASTDALGLNTAGTNITWTANSSGVSINNAGLAGTTTAITGNASITLNSLGLQFNGSGLAGTVTGATGGSITVNSSGVSINIPAAAGATYSYWNNFVGSNGSAVLNNSNSISFFPFNLPYAVSASYLRFNGIVSATSTSLGTTANTTISMSNVTTWFVGLYTLGTGASSASLMSVTTSSAGSTVQLSLQANANGSQYTVTYNITYPSLGLTTNAFASNQAFTNASLQLSTNTISNFTTGRYLDIPFATVIGPGPYWLALGWSSAAGNNGPAGFPAMAVSIGSLNANRIGNSAFNIPGAATNSSNLDFVGLGDLSSIGSVTGVALANLTSKSIWPTIELIRQA